MIEFEHKLPCMWADLDGAPNGTYNNYEVVLPSAMTTTDHRLGEFLHQLQNAIRDDRRIVFIDGRVLKCSNNWIRDHVHQMKAFKHWEYDLSSFLQFIIHIQREDGQYYELIKQLDDLHWQYVNEDCYIKYPEDNVAAIRLELEADIEYLVVEGAMQYYRATGDLAWVESVLPKLEKGIDYITSDPKRWDKEHGLVKRPFTIDTWDFKSTPNSGSDRKIGPDEKMSIMHGDNSGVYAAMHFLAFFREKLGDTQKARQWRDRAGELKKAMFRHLWNGKFFIHQLHLNHEGIDDREAERLSLSNGYDINRGVTDVEQSRTIIEEYMHRKETTKAFAEWFSIDPPYPQFNNYKAGEYINGAVSPFTAGEIAKAALQNGYESYGWDILSRFMEIMERDGDIYFLYYPDTMLPQGRGPSAWGAAALLSAVDEGLAGVEDMDCLYRHIRFCPRFTVTPYTELRYVTGYEVSSTFVDVRFIRKDDGMRYDLLSPAERLQCHILLPKGKSCKSLLVNGAEQPFELSRVGQSVYVDFEAAAQKAATMEILFD